MVSHRKMFDTLRVWNEYQDTDDVNLNFINDTISNMKKKFRIWRIDIPRDKNNPRQRIRNTWTKVKFTMKQPDEVTLKEIFDGAYTEFATRNEITLEWEDLNFKDHYATVPGQHYPEYVFRRFEYNASEDIIIESQEKAGTNGTTITNNVWKYILKEGVVHRYSYDGTPVRSMPYAYHKMYDMEIHDIGIVYFV